MMTSSSQPGRGQVLVRHHKALDASFDMREWPDVDDLLLAMSSHERVQIRQPGDREFWRAAFRWALLKKFDRCPDHLQDPYNVVVDDDGPRFRTLSFSNEDIRTIETLWEVHCALADGSSSLDDEDDLIQFLATATSNHRPLQWSLMDCGPACQFRLHAHPNLEVIYCLSGALHEIRMQGGPITKTFPTTTSTSVVQGPDLSSLDRPWKFATLTAGKFLVNEVGSIHRSFCATNGDGCLLLVLWGGSHADIASDQEPSNLSIRGAMVQMDGRLSSCDCGKWDTITETFLPLSERSNPDN